MTEPEAKRKKVRRGKGQWLDVGLGTRLRVVKVVGDQILFEVDAPPGVSVEVQKDCTLATLLDNDSEHDATKQHAFTGYMT